MSFSSIGEFFAMGGHGLYVWLSYGAAAIIVAYNVVAVRLRLRRFFRQARDLEQRAGPPGRPGAAPAAVEARGGSVRP